VSTEPLPIAALIDRLNRGLVLSEPEARSVFQVLLAGKLDQSIVEAILLAIAKRGPAVDELVGAALALRADATPVPITSHGRPILDTCGTGGAPKLFNVSTISAMVIAAAAKGRILVAKHGNRSRTGRGSAELLEALGLNISASPEVQGRCLEELGICFSFAPDHHPGARHAAAARKTLGVPTIFNLLGPLANPAGATCQIVGTYSTENAERLSAALSRLGVQRAMVVTSRDGRDEFTTTAPNLVYDIPGSQEPYELDSATLGLPSASAEPLTAGSLPASVALARAILARSPGADAARDLVLLNSAAGFLVCGLTGSWQQGIALAREAIDSGAAESTLTRWIALSNS
jgi:anthranilate phosphoribosyltransferase